MKNLQNQLKMKSYLVVLAVAGIITMISCSPPQKESKQGPVPQENQGPQTILTADTSATLPSVPATVPAKAASTEPAVINATGTPPKLNPAHGQPFHRCDIAVGSPLNAAPSVNNTKAAPTMQNGPRLNNPPVNNPTAPTVANANATPPKLNPAHGQPFHRCEIPVGSPLN